MNNEKTLMVLAMAKKAANSWRGSDAYHQAATIIDMLTEEVETLSAALHIQNADRCAEEEQ